MAFDIGYQVMKAKLNQENCHWLSGENVEKKSLRLRFKSLQRLFSIKIFYINCVEKGRRFLD